MSSDVLYTEKTFIENFHEGGFTLIEALIAAFLGAIVLLGLTVLYINGLEFYDEGASRLELQRQGSLAMEDMARNIRGGKAPSQHYRPGPSGGHH